MAERVIAVRVVENEGVRVIQGFTRRDKNRKLAWQVSIEGLSPAQIVTAVKVREAARVAPAGP